MNAARDLGAPGVDSVYGAGELQLPKPPDVVAPTVTALAGKGRKGRTMKLLSRVSDDSGEVGVLEEVKLRGKVVARFKTGLVHLRLARKDRRDRVEGARRPRRGRTSTASGRSIAPGTGRRRAARGSRSR